MARVYREVGTGGRGSGACWQLLWGPRALSSTFQEELSVWLRLGGFPGGVGKAWSPRARGALAVVPWWMVAPAGGVVVCGVQMALGAFPVAVHAADGMVLMRFRGPAVESCDLQSTISSSESFSVTREASILEELWPLAQRFGSCSFPTLGLASSALLHMGLHECPVWYQQQKLILLL